MVISDVEMPRLDGYSLARRIKSDPRFSATPFLLHSSLSGEINRERAIASGADAFIGKFNRRDLVIAVDACLKALAQRESKAS
jgi:two-component system chemotaxis response regulator CheV